MNPAGAALPPQVVVPGCPDFSNRRAGQVPDRYRDREFFQYNLEILLMRTDAQQFAALGTLFGERLRAAKGPVRALIPARGMSQPVGRKPYDLAGNERGAWTQPDTDGVFVATLRGHLPDELIRELPRHIKDAAFADACVAELIGFLRVRAQAASRRQESPARAKL